MDYYRICFAVSIGSLPTLHIEEKEGRGIGMAKLRRGHSGLASSQLYQNPSATQWVISPGLNLWSIPTS